MTDRAALILNDVRRLTGANLFSHSPGSVIDVTIQGMPTEDVEKAWNSQLDKIMHSLNWPEAARYIRFFKNGASFMLEGAIDQLYTGCDLLELAWSLTCEELGQPVVASFEQEPQLAASYSEKIVQLQQNLQEEQQPQLVALEAAADKANVPFLWDDDEISFGHGAGSQIFPRDALPSIEQVNWQQAKSIPCALVTGTNGKSTSVRLAATIAAAAGKSAGITSTDFIRVGKTILDYGDYSGPGGARILLRNPQSEMAFLEVARGGLLRRGLPLNNYNVALITNVAADHLGDYGINSVQQMAEAKFIVAKGLSDDGVLVLNADDENILTHCQQNDLASHYNICWFSLYADNQTLKKHIDNGGQAVYLKDEQIFYVHSSQRSAVITVNDIPMTMQGAARHNVQNAMGVIGLCFALNIELQFIQQGLKAFHSDLKDNPGWGNCFDYHGAKIFIDFAHNVHSVNAIVSTLKNMPAKRRLVLLGQAGDRSDDDIRKLTNQALELSPQRFIICELSDYLRGRKVGEVPQVFYQQLRTAGIADSNIEFANSPLAGAINALAWCQPGDLLLLLALSERDEIFKLLTEQ